jgi:ATP-dependent Clp protease ATP-binding subunit ClpC
MVALKLCEDTNYGFIDNEHLLYGLISIKSFSSILVKKYNINIKKIKEQLLEIVKDYGESESIVTSFNNEESVPIKNTALDFYGADMNLLALQKKYDPLIGREDELNFLIEILSRRNKNNPILLGEAGCGKTHLVEGLATMINEGNVPEFLLNLKIWRIDLGLMIAGSKLRGQFEERLYSVINQVKKETNFRIVLFIDEIHTIMGAGDPNGSMDAANILKPALSRGEIQIIGATTFSEYKNSIEKDKAMARRFQIIKLNEPNREETVEILKGLRRGYEEFHCVKIDDDILRTIVDLSMKHITDRYLPDKAIDILDQVSSKVKIKNFICPKEVTENKKRYTDCFGEIIKLSDDKKINKLNKELDELSKIYFASLDKWTNEYQNNPPLVKKSDVFDVLSSLTKKPNMNINKSDKESLQILSDNLKKEVIGQNDAIDLVMSAIFRSKARLNEDGKPTSSFLFVGDSGVGKSFLAKSLAKNLFGEKEEIIQFDMSEFSEKISASRLIGATPGYIGYDEGGQLVEAVRKKPHSIILLDEIEKAHPDVLDLLLQIFEEGKLTDGSGRTADFRDTIIIMTSNIGIENFDNKKETLGFGAEPVIKDHYSEVLKSVKKYFKIELINRLDKIIVFNKLNKNDIEEIFDKEIEKINGKMVDRKISFVLTDELKKYILNKIDILVGAREIKRVINENIIDFLAKEIIHERIEENSAVVLRLVENKIQIKNEH